MRKGLVTVSIKIEHGDGSETEARHVSIYDDNEFFPQEKIAETIGDCLKGISSPRLDELIAHLIVDSSKLNRLCGGADGLVSEAKKILAFWEHHDSVRDSGSGTDSIDMLGKYLRGEQKQ